MMDSLIEQDTCFRGLWKNGICVCESNYGSLFSDLDLHPMYCIHLLSEIENGFIPGIVMMIVSLHIKCSYSHYCSMYKFKAIAVIQWIL